MKKRILLLCGPSGSGKTYFQNMLNGETHKGIKFEKLEQVTTRPARSLEEVNTHVYSFITETVYDILTTDNYLVATTKFNGYRYGTLLPDNLNNDYIYTIVVNREGIKSFEELVGIRDYIHYEVIYIDSDELEERKGRDVDMERDSFNDLTNITRLQNNPDNRLPFGKLLTVIEDLFNL